jgi:hypothetical protein
MSATGIAPTLAFISRVPPHIDGSTPLCALAGVWGCYIASACITYTSLQLPGPSIPTQLRARELPDLDASW